MYEILKLLPAEARVLDLGCATGSFDAGVTAASVIRMDREARFQDGRGLVVEGDAAHLPFADGAFAAIICNHSLEHFDDLGGALREIGRVTGPAGALFASVPDASTFCDKLYRWLARGGGHVNAFTSADGLAKRIEKATGLKHVATRTLYTSLSFLNRRNSPAPRPRRLALLGGGREWSLFLFAWISRRIDRGLGLRTSVYGWALWFGNVAEPVDAAEFVNVCLRCGSGSSAESLRESHMRQGRWLGPKRYKCPQCGASNPFTA